jgi:hypothetical protein
MRSKARFSCDCIECDFRTHSYNKLIFHKNIDLGNKPFKCCDSGCDKSCANKYGLKDHIIFVHNLVKTVPVL